MMHIVVIMLNPVMIKVIRQEISWDKLIHVYRQFTVYYIYLSTY